MRVMDSHTFVRNVYDNRTACRKNKPLIGSANHCQIKGAKYGSSYPITGYTLEVILLH